MTADFVSRTVRSFDGTELACQSMGEGPGLPVILSNGLGGDYRAWKHVFDQFASTRTLATWDYRGLYRSGPPQSKAVDALGPPFQALDLKAVLDALGWKRVILVGWSMGVQVNFEAWRRFPDRIAGLGIINGVKGRPFDTALGSRFMRHVIPTLLKQMRRNAKLVRKLSSVATGWSGLPPALQRLGLVGATLDMVLFAEFAKTFASLDFDLYGATLEALGAHDASDVVPTVTVPVRIITGDRDILTPVATARALKVALPRARLRVLPGGTHYTPAEYPREVCEELGKLFAEVEEAG